MINLLPDDIKEDFSYGRKNRQILGWLITVLFGIFILLVVAGIGRLSIQTARNQTVVQKEAIEKQLKEADFKNVSDEYSDFSEGLGNVKKLYQQQILYSRLIRKLGTLLPPGAKLTNISISDKDKAISLNFDNDIEGLGPTIQLNLTDQSKQIESKSVAIFDESLGITVAGTKDIVTDTEKRTVSFYVNAPSAPLEEKLNKVVQNGGEMAFSVAYDELKKNQYLADYTLIEADSKSGAKGIKTMMESVNESTAPQEPQIRSYTVNTDQKYVDFVVRADTLEEAKTVAKSMTDTKNSLFIETYSFEDQSYLKKDKCLDNYTKKTTCDTSLDNCFSSTRNGCRYTVRAYYDELYKTATAQKASAEAIKECAKAGLACTHSVVATYGQLFSKVDINRVSACTTDLATNTSTCPVEMRAEFSADAKFYLINSAGVTK